MLVVATAAAADVDAVAAGEVDDVRDCLNREKNDVVSNIELGFEVFARCLDVEALLVVLFDVGVVVLVVPAGVAAVAAAAALVLDRRVVIVLVVAAAAAAPPPPTTVVG